MKKPAMTTHPNHWLAFSHLLPRKWGRIGHPIPVPGGYVFIVSVSMLGRRRYALNRFHEGRTEGAFAPVTDDMGRALILPDSLMARHMLAERAHKIESEEE